MNDTSLSNNQNTSVFFKNAHPTPQLLVSQLEAATSNGGNHPWRLTRQPKKTPNHCLRPVSCTICNRRPQPISEVYNPMCTIATYSLCLCSLSKCLFEWENKLFIASFPITNICKVLYFGNKLL